VILRVVSGRVSVGSLDSVAQAYRRTYVPVAEQSAGLVRYMVAVRATPDGGHDIAAMTLWASVEEALAAYAGDLTATRTVDGADHGETWAQVDYYEVETSVGVRLASVGPALLRVAVGRVARGLDADIQQELRRKLPNLPAEAAEAWIGRRVLDADVEIAFVSTWTTEPPGRALDEAIWPAVSARYDVFRVSVHEILIEGVGRG
jgi:hypothetical protein